MINELRVTHNCPKCAISEDIFENLVQKAKEKGLVSKDFGTPCVRQIVTPLITEQSTKLIVGTGSMVDAPLLIERFTVCAMCGTYYLKSAEVVKGKLGAQQEPPPPSSKITGK